MLNNTKRVFFILSLSLSMLMHSFLLAEQPAAGLLKDTALTGMCRVHCPTKNFQSFGGYDEILTRVSYLANYLKNPSLYIEAGLSAKGILISGPSGVGKKLLAEVIAGQARVPLISLQADVLQSSKNPEEKLAAIFEQAHALAPCVVCINEIEALVKFAEETHFSAALLPRLLEILADEHLGIVVIATTRNVNLLDSIALYPKYFDCHICLELPTAGERQQILQKHLVGKHLAEDLSLDQLSFITAQRSAADLVALISAAGFIAIEENCHMFYSRHFDQALMQFIEGPVKAVFKTIESKRLVAAHESGHAIVSHVLGGHVHKISVLSASTSWGRTIYIPREQHILTQQDAANQICACLAGRAAEILMETPTVSCSDDVRQAKALARIMVDEEAMGKTMLGNEGEVEEILQTQLARAVQILEDQRAAWEQLTDALVLKDQVLRAEFIDIATQKAANKVE